MTTVLIPLHSRKHPGHSVSIDAEDLERVCAHKWRLVRITRAFYAMTKVDGKTVYLHRFLMDAPKGKDVDHINGNGLDNRRSANLRICSRAENIRNKRQSSANTSGFKGVSWCKRTGRWEASIMVDGQHRYVGMFRHREDAALAYDAKARELFGEYAKCNFSD